LLRHFFRGSGRKLGRGVHAYFFSRPSSASIIWSISASLTLSAGMKRSRLGAAR
jgi:hypothetical protein